MSNEPPPESPGSLFAQARERSVRLAVEAAPRRGLPPGPGDLFVLAATAELPIEWVVLARREGPGEGAELLAVPADTCPLAGGGDVEVPDGAPGGPLTLRCRFGLWLAATLFEPALRTGGLAGEVVAEALERRRQVEAGDLETSPLAEEVEADPEYQDWIREVPARARELAAAARPRPAAGPVRRPWRWGERLAAVFALATLGLSLWVFELRREVKLLLEPVFDVPVDEVVLGSGSRGSTVIRVPEGKRQLVLTLVVDASLPPTQGHLEIVRDSGRQGETLIWQSPPVRLAPTAELTLILPRRILPDGEYRVRIVPVGAGAAVEQTFEIETGP